MLMKNESDWLAEPADPSTADLPVIGITMGCPVGVGPEIILRLAAESEQSQAYRLVVVGDINVLDHCSRELSIPVKIRSWRPDEIGLPAIEPGILPVLPVSNLVPTRLSWGRPDATTGQAMAGYIEETVRLVQAGTLAAMVTGPIAKSALHAAGYPFPGHTEMLASLCQTSDYAMMMAGDRLRVSLVTIHAPLAEVAAMLDLEEILRIIRLTYHALVRDFGISSPRIAVAGFNPHAGEGGLFGDEEERKISPAVSRAIAAGWQVTGPLPPDTVFNRALTGEFDAVVCMYHDQGLIPFKLIHFVDGVNVTLGLPIVRSSVDHGTAYDIAGKGLANPTSLRAACRLAATIAANRCRIKA